MILMVLLLLRALHPYALYWQLSVNDGFVEAADGIGTLKDVCVSEVECCYMRDPWD